MTSLSREMISYSAYASDLGARQRRTNETDRSATVAHAAVGGQDPICAYQPGLRANASRAMLSASPEGGVAGTGRARVRLPSTATPDLHW